MSLLRKVNLLTANMERSLKEKKQEEGNGKIFFSGREGTKISVRQYKVKFLESVKEYQRF